MQVARTLPLATSAPRAARRLLGQELEGRLPESVLEDVRLVVSELVTNAVEHSGASPGSHIGLRVVLEGDVVRVEVCDPGPGFARSRVGPGHGGAVGRPEIGSWGLEIVDHVASRWGVRRTDGTCVWAEVRLGSGKGSVQEAI